jgi:hypothetical protein
LRHIAGEELLNGLIGQGLKGLIDERLVLQEVSITKSMSMVDRG